MKKLMILMMKSSTTLRERRRIRKEVTGGKDEL
jgi:hypothetical protein